MENTPRDIVFEASGYWVKRVDYGFEVYRNEATHSVRCARIGYHGQVGLDRAKAEIERRISLSAGERVPS